MWRRRGRRCERTSRVNGATRCAATPEHLVTTLAVDQRSALHESKNRNVPVNRHRPHHAVVDEPVRRERSDDIDFVVDLTRSQSPRLRWRTTRSLPLRLLGGRRSRKHLRDRRSARAGRRGVQRASPPQESTRNLARQRRPRRTAGGATSRGRPPPTPLEATRAGVTPWDGRIVIPEEVAEGDLQRSHHVRDAASHGR